MQLPDLKKIHINPKYLRIGAIVLACLFVLLLIGGFIAYSKREALLQKAIAKAKEKARSTYNLDLEIGSARFTGLSTVAFSDITIVPDHRDSLLSIKEFTVSVKLMPLIFGNVKLAYVNLQQGHLNLTDINHVRNFDFLFKKKQDTTVKTKVDLSELSNNLINQLLYKIPDNLTLNNFLVSLKTDSSSFTALAQSALIKSGQLTSTINIDNGRALWHFDGRMHPSDKDIDIKLYAEGKKVEIPYIEKRFKLKVTFDTASTRLSKVEHSGGETRIYGYWGVSNLLINHPGLSSSDIVIPNAGIDANLFVGSNYLSLDSSSTIHLKKITAHPYAKYTLNPVKIYELKVNSGWQNAQDIFDSFPSGMFESLEGIQVTGKLNYKLNVFLNSEKPDDVQFDSRLDKDGFNIVKYGKTDLGKLNKVFTYVPYENGKPMAPRLIGPDNSYYTPLDEISPNLRNAVMTAEDPSFYTNHGFVEESIRKSLATDFKDKKFKRGGSTISMQLIKNSFLSREKTLSRKIEEILIVWLIENNRIMTKNRMLEVYFNIIEWGRDVYGIGEASRYYFGKSPAELTIGESIYLASIVPHPKTGLYSFEPDGSLRPGLAGYFNLIGNLMAGHGRAQRDSSNEYGFNEVRLKESMRREVAPVSQSVADSLIKQDDDEKAVPVVVVEPEVKKPTFFQRLFGKKDTSVVAKKEEIKKEDVKAKLKADIKKLRDAEEQKELLIDTAGKTRKEIRQEKRRLRDEEKQAEKALKELVKE
ncbi:transglycosylase domain-containing protein [Mucilaginibacter flavidus]|uniref:transglycosylase domain-containing protein n=1 Tax=Mucilaginibacter flavidus TaxID=2949309 RepID=UPI0020933189|nr:transglycosylase domain-containing protein [Mucilaginibacter flavidus]MCO5949192.1 transglycosylase domain-containing protein [Mucilaginibacter flavidus]